MQDSAQFGIVVLDCRKIHPKGRGVCDGQPPGGLRTWRTAEAVHIDVRGLEPPGPMVAILRMIDSGEAQAVLIAHLDREPIFLYPELVDRGWSYDVVSLAGDDGEVILKMARLGA
jgi:hypothetical protein